MKIIAKSPLLQQKKRTKKFNFFYKKQLSDNAYSDKKYNLQLYLFSKKSPLSRTVNTRYTRQEQLEHTSDRKKSFNRRWGKTAISVIRYLGNLFPIRHLFSYLANPFATTSIEDRANKNYLFNNYIYKNNSKNVKGALVLVSLFTQTTQAEYNMLRPKRFEAWGKPLAHAQIIQKRSRFMGFDEDSQPAYAKKYPQKGKPEQDNNGRANVSAYSLWVPPVEKREDRETVVKNIGAAMNDAEYQAFVRLVGKDVAMNYLRRVLENLSS